MIYFSSDWHFLHKNISGPKRSQWSSGYRNFEDEYIMTDVIINTINKYVKYDDVLYFLGDFAFKDHKKIPELRDRIVCQTIHVIRGNHDGHINEYKDKFTSIQDVLTLDIDGKGNPKKTIFMSHYSHRTWQGSHKGIIHLYGHSHNTIPDYGKSMDVGVDVAYKLFGEYRPFSLDEIVQIMSKRDVAFVDHHNLKTNI